MKSVPVSRARIVEIFRQVEENRRPIRLTSHNFSVVVVGTDDWLAIEQTLYRLSAPRFGSPRTARADQE